MPLLREHVEPALAAALGFTPMFQGAPLGFGMLAAGLVLAIMIVPDESRPSRARCSRRCRRIHRELSVGLDRHRREHPRATDEIVGIEDEGPRRACRSRAALGFTPMFQGAPLGFGMLAAGLVLAIMIVPTITSISREVLAAVPAIHREAALGLGATRWDAIRVAVLPSARSGLVGAVLLGLGRALGETMAVAMVIGNRPKISASLFDPACTMASAIANEFAEADTDLHLAALSELALTLLGAALVANLLARWLVARAEASAASPPSGTPSSDRAPRFVPRADRSAA